MFLFFKIIIIIILNAMLYLYRTTAPSGGRVVTRDMTRKLEPLVLLELNLEIYTVYI